MQPENCRMGVPGKTLMGYYLWMCLWELQRQWTDEKDLPWMWAPLSCGLGSCARRNKAKSLRTFFLCFSAMIWTSSFMCLPPQMSWSHQPGFSSMVDLQSLKQWNKTVTSSFILLWTGYLLQRQKMTNVQIIRVSRLGVLQHSTQVLNRTFMRTMMTVIKYCEWTTDSLNQYFPKKQVVHSCWLPFFFYHFTSSSRKTLLHCLVKSSDNNLVSLLKMWVGEGYPWENPILFWKWNSLPYKYTHCWLNQDRSINAFSLFLCPMTMRSQWWVA